MPKLSACTKILYIYIYLLHPITFKSCLHLLKFGDSAVSALNQVGGLLTDVARHLAPVALNEGLGLVPLHRLKDASQHEHAALQAVFCTLRDFLGSQSSRSISVQVVPVRRSVDLPLLCIIWTPDRTLITFVGKKTPHFIGILLCLP